MQLQNDSLKVLSTLQREQKNKKARGTGQRIAEKHNMLPQKGSMFLNNDWPLFFHWQIFMYSFMLSVSLLGDSRALEASGRQRGMACYSPWGHEESYMTSDWCIVVPASLLPAIITVIPYNKAPCCQYMKLPHSILLCENIENILVLFSELLGPPYPPLSRSLIGAPIGNLTLENKTGTTLML